MNILILFSQPWKVGGAETHVADLIRTMKAKGHSVFIITHGDKRVEQLDALVSKQWVFNFRSTNPLLYLKVGKQLCEIVQDQKIDIVHAHQRTAGYFGAYIKMKTGIPFVVTIHDPWKRALLKKMHSNIFSHIITVSEFLRQRFITEFGFDANRVHTIWNGVDENRYDPCNFSREELRKLREGLGISADHKVVSLIARLYSSKGHQYIIEAAPNIIKHIPEVRFLFVGSGEHEAKFKAQIQEKALCDYFIFTGYREDIPELIAISDIVTRPSDMEGLPINLIEAMLMEKPVVATGIAGVPEMIEHGENGFMIEPSDTENLAKYIIKLLSDSSLSNNMGQRGRETALRKFTLSSLGMKVENLYKLISRKDQS
ncbi:MAG: glycosyltransferase family 4 protein [Negativicutes bacterium]|nr:glycosyltransferase family 4 protein [Negativicutes bacterium]